MRSERGIPAKARISARSGAVVDIAQTLLGIPACAGMME